MATKEKNEKSMENAHHIFMAGDINNIPVGIAVSQQWIHRYLLDADIFRDKNIANEGSLFASILYLQAVLDAVERIPEDTFGHILKKYEEMNVRHHFRGSICIWFDMVLRRALGKIVNWHFVDNDQYFTAMECILVTTFKQTIYSVGILESRDASFKGVGSAITMERRRGEELSIDGMSNS